MLKNSQTNYTKLILKGFEKSFKILAESDPFEVAEWLYMNVSAFCGRDGKCICGGGENDIYNLVFAASGVNLEVAEARKIKNKLRKRLRQAWVENDHATLYYVAQGFERGASMKTIDYRLVFWAYEGV